MEAGKKRLAGGALVSEITSETRLIGAPDTAIK